MTGADIARELGEGWDHDPKTPNEAFDAQGRIFVAMLPAPTGLRGVDPDSVPRVYQARAYDRETHSWVALGGESVTPRAALAALHHHLGKLAEAYRRAAGRHDELAARVAALLDPPADRGERPATPPSPSPERAGSSPSRG